MKKLLLSVFTIFTTITFATDVVHDETYYKHQGKNTQIIFTKAHLPFAQRADIIENELHPYYEKSFNWELDETLYIGLLSHHNQIPNGYSTQYPINRQINYIGGSQHIDYFCSTSWLDTLLYHESAHNYQFNVKANGFSRFLHSVFGTGSFMFPLPLSVPNVMENLFMVEGNAVLNESWHGNGGRLYSGRFKAQTILQAKAGKITPQNVYNTTLNFPYGETYYITGGFYNLYMAQKYGIDNLNRYFHQHSKLFIWPQLTNHSMRKVTGVSFEDSLREFAQYYASKKFTKAGGQKFLGSQYYYDINSDENEVYFITNETGVEEPQLNIIDKKSLEIRKQKGSWLGGKVIKKDDSYYTIGYSYTSAFNIHQGLHNSDANILDSTKSKVLQGYLHSGKPVYFDSKSSYTQPNLFIGDKFFRQVNSSVHIDKDNNIYYFIQNGKRRTLYKNNTALFSYLGFYGIISDIDSNNNIYFIANSKNGSSLYKYSGDKVTRAHEADNILGAKLLNNSKVVLSAVGEDEYYYTLDTLKTIDEIPYNTTLFFEHEDYYEKVNYKNLQHKESNIKLDDQYNSLLDIHYSSTNLFLSVTNENSIIGNMNMNFADPLMQNQVSFLFSRDDLNTTFGGLSYSSNQYILNYSFLFYQVLDDNNINYLRDYTAMASLNIPFVRFSKYSGDLSLSYLQEYDTIREPLTLSLKYSRYEQYGKSMYTNYLNYFNLFLVKERDDLIYGGIYKFSHYLPNEFYLSFGAKYTQTDAKEYINTNGIKISSSSGSVYDLSQINIPNIKSTFYGVKNAGYADIGLYKVLNFSKYFFTFPISLQRESIYTKYRYYQLSGFTDNNYNMSEIKLGTEISLVGLNSFKFPITAEYIFNDGDNKIIDNKHLFQFMIGVDF